MLLEAILNQYDHSTLLFPPEWAKAALVLALISIWIVIALFAYLNRTTKKPYFSLWTVAWMFYSVYLAAAIGLTESPDAPFLVMARRACIGISALFMFWGSFQVTGHRRRQQELGLGVFLILVWSYVAAYKVGLQPWITIPVFVLLAAAGVYTGILYLRHRKRHRGGNILVVGFCLWGLHLLCFPFIESSPGLQAAAYLASAALSLLITVGMVVEHERTLSEQDYRALFDSANDAMFLVDCETRCILEANPSALRLADRPREQLIGVGFLDLFPDFCEIMPTGPGTLQEWNLPRTDKPILVYEASANLIPGPCGPVLLIDARDVTERKRATEALQKSAGQLQAALAELRAAQRQVVQQERLHALEKMASGLSHDFNNALAKILGFNELLRTRTDIFTDRELANKHLQMMGAAVLDAVNIVNRLGEFYRHRQDTDVYEAVNLIEVIEQAVLFARSKWNNLDRNGSELRLELPDVPLVKGRTADLKEAIINLILNGIEAMPNGGALSIATRSDGSHVSVEVRDTGSGMSEEVRQQCFEPFFSTKREAGTGLGLAIVHGVVHRHGGEVTLQSEIGKGTTVTVRLPICRDHPTEIASVPGVDLPPLNVLLVEDDPDIRDIQAEYLRGEGHSVSTATNGREGLERFRAGQFDLVVADRAMPEMDGDQMTEAIKSIRLDTPVIMVSGCADQPLDKCQRSAVPDIILSKPITQAELRQAIANVTTKAHTRQDAASHSSS